jgi:hypothetical protein
MEVEDPGLFFSLRFAILWFHQPLVRTATMRSTNLWSELEMFTRNDHQKMGDMGMGQNPGT